MDVEGVGHRHDDVLDHLSNSELVAPAHVGLEHRELGRVAGINALVAEHPTHLVDPIGAADHRPLEIELKSDTQTHVNVEGIEVGIKRAGCGTTVDQLQDRSLDLKETALVEGATHRAGDNGAGAHHLARLFTNDEIRVATTHPALLRELLMEGRQRTQSLGGHPPLSSHDG